MLGEIVTLEGRASAELGVGSFEKLAVDLDVHLLVVEADQFEIPDVGHAAYFVDPSGRTVGVHQAPAD